MEQNELLAVIVAHGQWLQGDKYGCQANLRGTNLRGADLREANLRGADLGEANLRGADLGGTDLGGTDLGGADLQFCRFEQVVWPQEELTAMARLRTLIPPDAYGWYRIWGQFHLDGAQFGRFEFVGLPEGWYCTTIDSPQPLPPTDRLIHRLLLYRKGKAHFLTIANKQI